jgi:protein ImuB
MMQRRILALWFPRLPTDRLKRLSDTAPDHPLVLAAKSGNALRLTALDDAAAALDLHEDMALADARAMIASLDVREADELADATLLMRIADWCDRFTPFVALDPPHGLLLDVTGVTHLFGGERGLLDLAERSLRDQGFTVQAALAGTAMAARALAHHRPGTIVPPGEEARAVAPLPVEALPLEPLTAHGLRRAGLKTIGQIAGRSRAELTARFGAGMVAALDEALGQGEAPISPRRPLPAAMAEHRFAEPVMTEDVIAHSLKTLAASLCALLEERGQGARRIEAVFFRADGLTRRIAIAMGRPVRDAAIILRLFRERLRALADPLEAGFGFDLIRLEVSETGPMTLKPIGFETEQDPERQIGTLIDCLAARLGPSRVLRLQPQNTHIPEAASRVVSAQGAATARLSWEALRSGDDVPRRPLRLFERPEPVEVMAEVPEGPPLRFRWRRVLHRIARAEGPERIAMEWWRADGPTRDYFRVEDEAGQRFWLYRNGLYGAETMRPDWFVHGLFA